MSCDKPQYTCETTVCNSGGTMCPTTHCGNLSASVKQYCNCEGPWSSLKVNGVCPFTSQQGAPMILPDGSTCYCCCSCFAWGTPIQVPGGGAGETFKPIEQFVVGDLVMVADADLSWSQRVV